MLDLEKGEVVCLVGEGTCVRLNVQYFCVVDQGLKDVVAEAIRFEWSDVAGEELLNGFELVFMQDSMGFSIHEKSQKLFFLLATLFLSITLKLILDLFTNDFFDDVFKCDQADFPKIRVSISIGLDFGNHGHVSGALSELGEDAQAGRRVVEVHRVAQG